MIDEDLGESGLGEDPIFVSVFGGHRRITVPGLIVGHQGVLVAMALGSDVLGGLTPLFPLPIE
jgi:hypothetical protein